MFDHISDAEKKILPLIKDNPEIESTHQLELGNIIKHNLNGTRFKVANTFLNEGKLIIGVIDMANENYNYEIVINVKSIFDS